MPILAKSELNGLAIRPYSSFHTTAMCSTTRAALLTGAPFRRRRCLANFDSGYPGYRGKIAREAGTIAEMLRPRPRPAHGARWRTGAQCAAFDRGALECKFGFFTLISWSGLDVGCDRGSPVSHYAAPFTFTGAMRKVVITMNPEQALDSNAVARSEMARQ